MIEALNMASITIMFAASGDCEIFDTLAYAFCFTRPRRKLSQINSAAPQVIALSARLNAGQ